MQGRGGEGAGEGNVRILKGKKKSQKMEKRRMSKMEKKKKDDEDEEDAQYNEKKKFDKTSSYAHVTTFKPAETDSITSHSIPFCQFTPHGPRFT
ncbi:hypothetical protein Pmani_011098 [Petrolisthes manimaculis]|uniref:Uncharacterized protein n=1 Tax=Petrolisthes manimaculis TaxID=1843537 RepID=A0AAE1Q0A2_9EUCA|nr:hypothetical protein Pmani_011098 [Petrolisthes manimaculis]